MIGASGHPTLNLVKGYNGSILWGLLFKPYGWLKLTLLAIRLLLLVVAAT